jgi:hypothetical protein
VLIMVEMMTTIATGNGAPRGLPLHSIRHKYFSGVVGARKGEGRVGQVKMLVGDCDTP